MTRKPFYYVAMALAGALFFARVFVPEGETLWRTLAGASKFLGVLGGALAAWGAERHFEPGTLSRRAARSLFAWFATWSCGQVAVSYYLAYQGTAVPNIGVADAFFVLGYGFAYLWLLTWLKAARDSGLPLAPISSGLNGAGLAIAAAISVPLLYFGLMKSSPLLERVVNAAYPVLDLGLCVMLLRVFTLVSQLRGGRIASAWFVMIVSIVGFAIGDATQGLLSAEVPRAVVFFHELIFALGYLGTGLASVMLYELGEPSRSNS